MKRAIFWGVLTMGLLPMVLISPSVAKADFFQHFIPCPVDRFEVLSVDTTLEINDVIVSATGPATFELFLKSVTSGNEAFIMELFLRRRSNVVINFSGRVQATPDQAVFANCRPEGDTTPNVGLTIVGSAGLPPAP